MMTFAWPVAQMFQNPRLYISQIFAAVGCFMYASVLGWLANRHCYQTWKPQTQPVARDAEARRGHVSPACQFLNSHVIPTFSAKHVPHSKTCGHAMSQMAAYGWVSRVLAISFLLLKQRNTCKRREMQLSPDQPDEISKWPYQALSSERIKDFSF